MFSRRASRKQEEKNYKCMALTYYQKSAQKIKVSIKDFFSKCDQILKTHSKVSDNF